MAIFGLVFSVAIFLFMNKFMDLTLKKDLALVKAIPFLIKYIVVLIIEIIKAALGVVPFIFGKQKPEAVIVKFDAPLKNNITRALLANSITLTPGTITAKLEDSHYTVHCLDKSMSEGMDQSIFVKQLLKIEEVLGNE